jgi:excisionase family DNA binding protein
MSASCILGNMPYNRPITGALLTPAEVAELFRVDPKTVQRWAKAGKLTSIRTLGGHRRYRESEVRRLRDEAVVTVPIDPDEVF